jgi:hypothetical protein
MRRYVDPSVVICKTSRIADCAVIREIGIRCDGAYFLGKSQAEESLLDGNMIYSNI